MDTLNFGLGINWRLPGHQLGIGQCCRMDGFRWKDGYIETIPGTIKYNGTSIGSDPITAIMPYYGDDVSYRLLIASGDKVYIRNDPANQFEVLEAGLSFNRIVSHCMRLGVMYIPSDIEGLKKYLGGNEYESVGGGASAPPPFKYIVWMKEIDRMFGLTEDGYIYWSDISAPEVWDPLNVDRMKLEQGEKSIGLTVMYGKLLIYNSYSVWIYYVSGNEENWKLEKSPTSIGCRSFKTLKRVDREDWFLGESPQRGLGIYGFNGSTSRLLTDDVNPLFKRINTNESIISECCAEYHDDLYTFSFPLDFAVENNKSIDLDTVSLKANGAPVIYGVHPYGFFSSAVLNSIDKNKEFLMGDKSDGFVYRQGGQTLKSVNGTDGSLIAQRFLGPIHNDGSWGVMKRYEVAKLYLVPTGSFNAKFRYYLSYGPYQRENLYSPHYHGDDFDVFEYPIYGVPDLVELEIPLSVNARGLSIQIEIINETTSECIKFLGYSYEKSDLYPTKKVQSYEI